MTNSAQWGRVGEKQLDALTTDEMFEGQRFAILAMFFEPLPKTKSLMVGRKVA